VLKSRGALDLISAQLSQKEESLVARRKALDSVIVAYSGGVDSSLLAYYARRVLQDAALIVIAVSPSLAQDELSAARAQAEAFSFNLLEIETNELDKDEYARNDAMRCYVCKGTLFESLQKLAAERGMRHIAYGANVNDLSDFRPGQKAAREFSVVSPLLDAGLGKEEIRQLAYQAGLPSWDRPQAACLSSRFPTFEKVTIEGLSQVDRAEAFLHSLGFKQIRVRHHGDIARIEIDEPELEAFLSDTALLSRISARLKEFGYRYVTVDLEPYRQGSSNRLTAAVAEAES
jgi:uncharacterized protein